MDHECCLHNTCVLQYNPGLGHFFSFKMFYLLKDSIKPGDQHLKFYIKIHYKGKGGAR